MVDIKGVDGKRKQLKRSGFRTKADAIEGVRDCRG